MNYFVTGATGFIGRFLLARLAKRQGNIYCLVRSEKSAQRLRLIGEELGVESDRLLPVVGDITQPYLGINDEDQQRLSGRINHFVHLAALYDMKAGADDQVKANVDGTKNALQLADAINVGCFHHISSIAAAGLYRGTFTEQMFNEAEHLEHPYFLTKHLAEKAVRECTNVPHRIYRPGIVVGDSNTGEAERADGPYMFFKLLQQLRDNLPKWVPLLGVEGGRLNIVPVDFVADAIDHLMHQSDLDGECFHLTDPNPLRAGEVLNLFAEAAHAPQMALRVNLRLFNFIPRSVLQMAMNYPLVKSTFESIMAEYGLPSSVLHLLNYPTRFESSYTQEKLAEAGIVCPPLRQYSTKLWDYWERQLDDDLFPNRGLTEKLSGKTVLISGASSGIGLATAKRLACAGGKLLLVARSEEQLAVAKAEVEEKGAEVYTYSADLSDAAQIDALLEQVKAEHGNVDVLINNAGRSIRRAVSDSKDRFHDFERTMSLNYFGSLRLILGFLDGMEQRRAGHVINISSIGVLTNAPRFSAYVASKAALDAFSRCAASEYSDMGIRFTTINMPLVRTPMIAPTKIYNDVPTLTPEEAAELVVQGLLKQPKRIATRLGILGAVLHAVAPKFAELLMNSAYRMFPDSKSQPSGGDALANKQEQIQFAALLRGIHF